MYTDNFLKDLKFGKYFSSYYEHQPLNTMRNICISAKIYVLFSTYALEGDLLRIQADYIKWLVNLQ